ncbi:MAG TPA: DUF2950 domain-containing protein [Candidatus Eremiobacteraceae bacterium]|nr:DUF2950 domain-containing protein [Candidatus Eremiobacteraceae bacterium]
MSYDRHSFEETYSRVVGTVRTVAMLAAGIAFLQFSAGAQQPGQKTFSSAAEASRALVAAAKAQDESALLEIFGPDAKDIVSSGDAVEDKNHRDEFVQKYHQMHRLVMEPDGKTTLYIGAENWPTPIPLAHKGGLWYFDTAAGKQQILFRRIGKNEMAVIQVCHELVDAQKEYYGHPHDGDSGSQYAQKFSSDAGKHNGLYWQASAGEGESPIGPLMASAAAEGYPADLQPQPFQGYYFRILTAKKATNGASSYIVDGKMTRGFAFLAYPAEYRSSGVMTFIVDEDGIVYEKDLGRRTPEIAKKLTRYDRDASWHKAD